MVVTIILSLAVGLAVAFAVWQYSVARSEARQSEGLKAQLDSANRTVAEAAPRISRLEAEITASRQQLAMQTADAERDMARINEANELRISELRRSSDNQLEQLGRQLAEANLRMERLTASATELAEENARLRTSLDHLNRQAAERDEVLKTQFRNLANDILHENSAQFKTQNAERLTEILSPLMTNIEEFKRTVRENHEAETKDRSSLAATIVQLRSLNDCVIQETRNLTSALKGNNKVQGDWGEMVLESILATSGLTEGREYTLQATTDRDGNTLHDEQGRGLRPDVIVDYPDGSRLVIDAKTNLSNYFDSIDTTLPDDRREEALRLHALAVKAQVDSLARRDYSAYVGESRIDMVMMFIPNEPAYMTAMHSDPKLWDYAYSRKVLIVSPTHLIAALRLIKNLWVRNQVTTNALEIARVAGQMYDKFAGFTTDLDKIRTSIASSQTALDQAFSKLATGKGNLVRSAERLRALGAKTSKSISTSIRDISGLDLPDAASEE